MEITKTTIRFVSERYFVISSKHQKAERARLLSLFKRDMISPLGEIFSTVSKTLDVPVKGEGCV